jgi:galactokinase
LHRLGLLSQWAQARLPLGGWALIGGSGKCGFQPIEAMATRTRKTSSSKPRRTTRGSSAKAAAPPLPGISAAERRSQAQEEARWRAESDLRTLRQAEEIRRDPNRLKRAATMAAEEMRALQAVRAIKRGS